MPSRWPFPRWNPGWQLGGRYARACHLTRVTHESIRWPLLLTGEWWNERAAGHTPNTHWVCRYLLDLVSHAVLPHEMLAVSDGSDWGWLAQSASLPTRLELDRSRTNLWRPSKYTSCTLATSLHNCDWRAWWNQRVNWNSRGPALHSVPKWTKRSEREGWVETHSRFTLIGALKPHDRQGSVLLWLWHSQAVLCITAGVVGVEMPSLDTSSVGWPGSKYWWSSSLVAESRMSRDASLSSLLVSSEPALILVPRKTEGLSVYGV